MPPVKGHPPDLLWVFLPTGDEDDNAALVDALLVSAKLFLHLVADALGRCIARVLAFNLGGDDPHPRGCGWRRVSRWCIDCHYLLPSVGDPSGRMIRTGRLRCFVKRTASHTPSTLSGLRGSFGNARTTVALSRITFRTSASPRTGR